MGKRIKTSGASEFFKQLDEDARRGVAALNGLLEDPAHRTGRAVAAAELDGDTVKTLDFKGVLHRIVDGWYYVDEPGRWEWDDPMPWKMAFWHLLLNLTSLEFQYCPTKDLVGSSEQRLRRCQQQ